MIKPLQILFLTTLLMLGYALNGQIRLEENRGQWPEEVLFRAEIPSGRLYLEKDGLFFHFFETPPHLEPSTHADGRYPQRSFKISFEKCRTDYQIESYWEGPYYTNYYLGNDSSNWASKVRNYLKIKLVNLYPGIDFVLEGGEFLKTEYHIHPGASPKDIKLSMSGLVRLELKDEQLYFKNDILDMMELKPFAYQVNGQADTTRVECSYQVKNKSIAYKTGNYAHDLTLIIDPYLVFSTYSGSYSDNWGNTACFDELGNAFSGGIVKGNAYPFSSGAFDSTYAAEFDIGIIKYDSLGLDRIWATYIGGQQSEIPHSMIADADNNLIIFGTTGSADFPVTSTAYDTIFNGGTALNYLNIVFGSGVDMYVSKLSSDGTAMLGSTFLGGSLNDGINYKPAYVNFQYTGNDSLYFNYGDGARGEVILDAAGTIYIGSTTFSTDFPLINAFQPASQGLQEGMLACFSPDLTTLNWSSYLGGSANDAVYSLDIDPAGNLVFAGGTCSDNLAVTDSIFPHNALGGSADGFVGKVNTSTISLSNLLRYGSATYDQVYFVKTDLSGGIYITGQTKAPDSTLILNSLYNQPNSGQFIAKIAPDFKSLEWSTVFGLGDGDPDIALTAFAVDLKEQIYLSGWGRIGLQNGASSWANFQGIKDMDVTPGAYQTNSDGQDFYLMVLSADGNCLKYATFFGEYHYSGCSSSGRDHVDGGTSRFDKRGYIYQSVCASCGGCQHFPTYPTGSVWSEVNHSGNCNNALFKFEFESAVVLEPRFVCNHLPVQIGPANPSSTATYTWKPAGLVSNSSQPNPFTTNIQTDTTLVLFILEGACLDSVYQPVNVENVQYLLPDSLSGCEFDTFHLAAIQMADSSSVLWSHQPDFSTPFNVGQEELAIEQSASGYVYFLAESSHCSYIDSVWLKVDNLETGMVDSAFICLGDTLLLQALTYPNQSLNYLWHPDSILLSDVSNPAVSVLPAQTQWVYVDVANEECFNRDSIWVGISPLSMHTGELIQEEVDSIYRTQTATIEAEQIWGVNYVWTPSGSLNDSTASTVLANPQNTTDYLLEISDAIGCFIEDSIKIIVLDVYCDESHVYVPNGFSPNNDGKNDKLFVRTKMGNSIAFSVYSRLGEKVFETSDPAIGWDGSYKGEQLEPAVFVYHLFVTCWDGSTYETHGNITLIR